MHFALLAAAFSIAPGQTAGAELSQGAVVEALSWRIRPGVVLVPLREVMAPLEVVVEYDAATTNILVDQLPLPKEWIEVRDKTTWIDLVHLQKWNQELGMEWRQIDDRTVELTRGISTVTVFRPPHRVEVSLKEQKLRGWQGSRLYMETNCSTGKGGYRTPAGVFDAGPEYTRHRVSRKYDNAPMPYAVQVEGGVFIHGSSSVPRYPASHGCVRMPMWGENAARMFFEWVEPGSEIRIEQDFLTPLPAPLSPPNA